MTTIIGAGLGGLTLARMLQKQGKKATIYEAEPHRDSRAQGGVLDMHEDSGQAALTACGLLNKFKENIIPAGDEMRILDKAGTVLWEETHKTKSERPEIDRLNLRNLLIEALEPNTIQWGRKLQNAEYKAGSVALTFADGTQIETSNLVGADGAWSKVRRLLSDVKPSYTGVTFFDFYIHDVIAYPEEAATVGRGSLFALQDNKGVIGHRHGDGSIQIYAALRASEEETKAVTTATLMGAFGDWAPQLSKLLVHSQEGFTTRPLYALPVGFTWKHRPGVTLLGDAAHVMSPFAGEGANLAMIDGADLAVTEDWRAYEQKMWDRSAVSAGESADNLEACIAKNGSKVMADMMRSFTEAGAREHA